MKNRYVVRYREWNVIKYSRNHYEEGMYFDTECGYQVINTKTGKTVGDCFEWEDRKRARTLCRRLNKRSVR